MAIYRMLVITPLTWALLFWCWNLGLHKWGSPQYCEEEKLGPARPAPVGSSFPMVASPEKSGVYSPLSLCDLCRSLSPWASVASSVWWADAVHLCTLLSHSSQPLPLPLLSILLSYAYPASVHLVQRWPSETAFLFSLLPSSNASLPHHLVLTQPGLCPPPSKSTRLEIDKIAAQCTLNPTCKAFG